MAALRVTNCTIVLLIYFSTCRCSLMRYWINRLKPLVQRPVKMVVCNRLGTEKGSTFAGTSCAIDLGKVAVVDNLADEAGLLLVDL